MGTNNGHWGLLWKTLMTAPFQTLNTSIRPSRPSKSRWLVGCPTNQQLEAARTKNMADWFTCCPTVKCVAAARTTTNAQCVTFGLCSGCQWAATPSCQWSGSCLGIVGTLAPFFLGTCAWGIGQGSLSGWACPCGAVQISCHMRVQMRLACERKRNGKQVSLGWVSGVTGHCSWLPR